MSSSRGPGYYYKARCWNGDRAELFEVIPEQLKLLFQLPAYSSCGRILGYQWVRGVGYVEVARIHSYGRERLETNGPRGGNRRRFSRLDTRKNFLTVLWLATLKWRVPNGWCDESHSLVQLALCGLYVESGGERSSQTS